MEERELKKSRKILLPTVLYEHFTDDLFNLLDVFSIFISLQSVFLFMNFTAKLGEDIGDGKLPSLDINIWVEGMTILYEFFENTMASNLMVEAGSALSKEVKHATLSEEVARRLRNTS